MASLDNKAASNKKYSPTTLFMPLSSTAAVSCAQTTSGLSSTASREAACNSSSSPLKAHQPLQHARSNHEVHKSVAKEDKERPLLQAALGVGPGLDLKDYAKTFSTARYPHEPDLNHAPLPQASPNRQVNVVDRVKDAALHHFLPLGAKVMSGKNSASIARYTPDHSDLVRANLLSAAFDSYSRNSSRPTHLAQMPAATKKLDAALVAHSTSASSPTALISSSLRDAEAGGGAYCGRTDKLRAALANSGQNDLPPTSLGETAPSDPGGRKFPLTLPQTTPNAGAKPSQANVTVFSSKLDCSEPNRGNRAPPSSHELQYTSLTRPGTATALPFDVVSAPSQRPKPPPTQRQADPADSPDESFQQPLRALTVRVVALYKQINRRYWHQRRIEAPGPKYNNGYDDKDGHYIVLPGEEILNRFTVQEVLGKGSFGTVIRCYDEKRHEVVALKITRHGVNFREQAKLELDILLKLNENPNLNHLVVKLLKVFDWKGHLVLMFELLSFNLYQLIKCTRYKGVGLDLVCKFAYQLVCALRQLEQQKPQPIIHCDIKPENILLRNQNRSGIRLIDFGSACYANKRIHRYIQSRFYRSPEVILYLSYSTAIDRWSLACVLVELHTGVPLFDGRSEAEQLARFEAVLGPLPQDMIASSNKASKYYNLLPDGTYELKEPALPRRPLDVILGINTDGPHGRLKEDANYNESSYDDFLDFTLQLLKYRPEERISCANALQHPFFSSLLNSKRGLPAAAEAPPGKPAFRTT